MLIIVRASIEEGNRMVSKKMSGIAVIAAVLLAEIAALPVNAAPTYTATRLGTLGGTGGYGNAINAAGQATGFSYTPGNATWHAVIYAGGSVRDLGTLGAGDSKGTAINAGGQVTGYSAAPKSPTFGTVQHAFLYSNGAMLDLGTLGGGSSYGRAINDSGQVTGDALVADNQATHAF